MDGKCNEAPHGKTARQRRHHPAMERHTLRSRRQRRLHGTGRLHLRRLLGCVGGWDIPGYGRIAVRGRKGGAEAAPIRRFDINEARRGAAVQAIEYRLSGEVQHPECV